MERNKNSIWTYLFKSWNSGWELTWKMMLWTNSRYLNFEAYTYLVMHNAAVMWCHSKDTSAFPRQTTRLMSDDCVGTSKCIIQKSYMPFWITYIANICMYILNSLVGTLSSCQSRESTYYYKIYQLESDNSLFWLLSFCLKVQFYYLLLLQLLYYLLFLFISNWNSLDYI